MKIILLLLFVSVAYADTWPQAVLDDLAHYEGQIIHCRIPDIDKLMKIKFAPRCGNQVNWQCMKDVEVWIGPIQFEITDIATFNHPFVDGGTQIRMSETDILIMFQSRSGAEYYIDLQMEMLDWIDSIDEANAMFEFDCGPAGEMFYAYCGIFNPQKYGDGYEAW